MKIFNHDKCIGEKQEILKTFESTIIKVLESMERTQNKFAELVSKVEVEHFKQLEKHSENQFAHFEAQIAELKDIVTPKQPEPQIEKIGTIDNTAEMENSIEKEEQEEFPLGDIPRIPMVDGIKVQVEGQEEIYPIHINNS